MPNTDETLQDDQNNLKFETDIQIISTCERRVKVTIPREEIERYYQKQFDGLTETAYMPGFRAGKAPKQLIEKRFRRDAAAQVKHDLVLDAISQVSNSKELTPIGEADFDYPALVMPEQGPFVFEFDIEVRPDFELPEWKGLKLEKPVKEYTSEDVEKSFQRVLAAYGTLKEKEGTIESGDYIVADIEAKDGDTLISSRLDETICVRPSLSFHDTILKDFDKQLSNAKAGDTVKCSVEISQDAANTEYRGKTIDLIFNIKKVNVLELPTLNESFLQRLGDFTDEADFKDAILDSLQQQLDFEQRKRLRQQILDHLKVGANWQLPPTLLANQSEREFKRTILELKRSGYSDNDIQNQINFLRQNSGSETARMLKEHFIFEKIAEIEGVEDLPEDYENEIALIAAQNNQTPRKIQAMLEKTGQMDFLRNQIVERKVIDLIVENAKITETPFEFENFTSEAIDWAAAGDPNAIAEVTAEDLKAVNQDFEIERKIDPNKKST